MQKVLCVIVLAVLPTVHASAKAQSLELGASVGWYQPLSDFRLGGIASTDLPQHASELHGVEWGGEARVRFRNRTGVGAVFATATSTVPGCTCPGGSRLSPTGERVSVVALEGLYTIPASSYELSLGLGPALIRHGGEGYGRYGSPRSWGAVGAIEIARNVTSHFGVTARALATTYSFSLDFPPQSGRQFDLLMSLGGRWRLHSASPSGR